mmetsp:Transcript_30174/g.85208  ORF Transcript_30174/g.85208 Transcript_30174/m.85208 type:complete len:208 (+) Transcript_30174:1181-1804(+)
MDVCWVTFPLWGVLGEVDPGVATSEGISCSCEVPGSGVLGASQTGFLWTRGTVMVTDSAMSDQESGLNPLTRMPLLMSAKICTEAGSRCGVWSVFMSVSMRKMVPFRSAAGFRSFSSHKTSNSGCSWKKAPLTQHSTDARPTEKGASLGIQRTFLTCSWRQLKKPTRRRTNPLPEDVSRALKGPIGRPSSQKPSRVSPCLWLSDQMP